MQEQEPRIVDLVQPRCDLEALRLTFFTSGCFWTLRLGSRLAFESLRNAIMICVSISDPFTRDPESIWMHRDRAVTSQLLRTMMAIDQSSNVMKILPPCNLRPQDCVQSLRGIDTGRFAGPTCPPDAEEVVRLLQPLEWLDALGDSATLDAALLALEGVEFSMEQVARIPEKILRQAAQIRIRRADSDEFLAFSDMSHWGQRHYMRDPPPLGRDAPVPHGDGEMYDIQRWLVGSREKNLRKAEYLIWLAPPVLVVAALARIGQVDFDAYDVLVTKHLELYSTVDFAILDALTRTGHMSIARSRHLELVSQAQRMTMHNCETTGPLATWGTAVRTPDTSSTFVGHTAKDSERFPGYGVFYGGQGPTQTSATFEMDQSAEYKFEVHVFASDGQWWSAPGLVRKRAWQVPLRPSKDPLTFYFIAIKKQPVPSPPNSLHSSAGFSFGRFSSTDTD